MRGMTPLCQSVEVTMLNYLVNVRKLLSACLNLTLFTFENWGQYALDFLGMAGKGQYSLRFADDLLVFLRPNTTDKWVVQEIMLRDDYRLQSMALSQATVIDLGANIGLVSLRAATLGATRVYAYEPEPDNYGLLTKNVASNRFESVIETFAFACTDKEQTLDLYMSTTNVAGHSIYGGDKEKITVRSTTLPRIFEAHAIAACDLLKIDVEGSEFLILYSLPAELFARIKRIHLECHHSSLARHNSLDLTAYLKHHGYEVEAVRSVDWRISRLYCQRP